MNRLGHWLFQALIFGWIACLCAGFYLDGVLPLLPLLAVLILVQQVSRSAKPRRVTSTGVSETLSIRMQTAARTKAAAQ